MGEKTAPVRKVGKQTGKPYLKVVLTQQVHSSTRNPCRDMIVRSVPENGKCHSFASVELEAIDDALFVSIDGKGTHLRSPTLPYHSNKIFEQKAVLKKNPRYSVFVKNHKIPRD